MARKPKMQTIEAAPFRASPELSQALFEQTADSIFITTAQGRYLEVNQRGCELLGCSRAELLRLCWEDFIPAEEFVSNFLGQDDWGAEEAGFTERRLRGKDGRLLTVEIWMHRLADNRLLTFVRDITERKRAQEALRRSTERLYLLHEIDADILVAQSPTAIVQTTLKRLHQLIPCERASVTLFDFEAQEAVVFNTEVSQDSPVQVDQRQPLDPDWIATLKHSQTLVVVDTLALAQPTPLAKILMATGVRSYMNVSLIAGGELLGVVTLASDRSGAFNAEHTEIIEEVTSQLAVALQQARLREQVSSARERLEALSRQLLETQETERRLIARELHDEIGQSLSMVKIDLQTLQQLPQARNLAARFNESIAMVERALQQARTLSVELRPSLLDDLGLIPALRWYVDRQAQRGSFTTRLFAPSLEARLTPELETVCYRLTQEALTNVIRHAQARQVEVELQQREAELWLSIRDDGLGFEAAAALKRVIHEGTSLGLLSMQERVALVGGQLDIESTPGRGTVIRTRLPLKYAAPVQLD